MLSGQLWPAHPKPQPDELLSSWIVRIAQANGLKLQTFCDFAFGKEHQLWNRDIDRLAPGWLLTELARRTGTPVDVIHRTTLDTYRGRLYHERNPAGQLRWILPAGIYHRTRRRFGIQFCPYCLANDPEPYFRTRWRVALLTFCSEHHLKLHDRCPACGAPIAFHRRELGRPEVADAGPLCLCHSCNFDLRRAARIGFTTYEASIDGLLKRLALHTAGEQVDLNIGHTDVLHQLCRIMAGTLKPATLTIFVERTINAPHIHVPGERSAFESRPIELRSHVIQLAAWILADHRSRIPAAWKTGSVRYNHFLRDFPLPPDWYTSTLGALNRGW